MKKWLPIVLSIFSSILLLNFSIPSRRGQNSNTKPQIKILKPSSTQIFKEGERVLYKIEVSDKEDGESKYNEIEANKVILELQYLPLEKKAETPEKGLNEILSSNCLNCHLFKGKLIGPSFYEINRRYSFSDADSEEIIKRIKNGSSGIWGNPVMPAHPELTDEQISKMVAWINDKNVFNNTDYYTGLEGSILINNPGTSKPFSIKLTATYTDNGSENGQPLKNEDSIIIKVN